MTQEQISTNYLNMQFFQYYSSGQRIRVEFPGGRVRQGRVAVSQGKCPQFYLSNGCRSLYELVPGCNYIGPALRKSRIDNRDYLNGRKPTFYEEGKNPMYTCRRCGYVPNYGSIINLRRNSNPPYQTEFQCLRCLTWQRDGK